MDSPTAKPAPEWLDHLHESQQWERLEKLARNSLEADPTDVHAHSHLAWALLRTGRVAHIMPHVQFMLDADPESINAHQLAAIHDIETGRHHTASLHLDTALSLSPRSAPLHHLAAILYCRQAAYDQARTAIAKARSLNPDSTTIARLYIDLHHGSTYSTTRAWERIQKFEEVLERDPGAAEIHQSMGKVFLNELKLPHRAEECFRRSLSIDPNDKDGHYLLWSALRSRSVIFCTLRLPFTAWSHAKLRLSKSVGITTIILIKPALVFLFWLLCAFVLFAPAAFVYEWLVMQEMRKHSYVPMYTWSWWRAVERWPASVRYGICITLILAYWSLLLHGSGTSYLESLEIIGLIFLFHFLFVWLLGRARMLLSAYGRWQARRRARRLALQTTLATADATPRA